MDLTTIHISPRLLSLISSTSKEFEDIFMRIQSDDKNDYKNLLLYVNYLLDPLLTKDLSADIDCLHLHFDTVFSNQEKILVAEFIVIKMFLLELDRNPIEENNDRLEEVITQYERKLTRLKECPEDASARNGGNAIWKKWKKDIKDTDALLKFALSIRKKSVLTEKTILNLQHKIYDPLAEYFRLSPYAVNLETTIRQPSYVVMNLDKKLNDLGLNIDDINSVVLFDCESKKTFFRYGLKDLEVFNAAGAAFKNLLIITYGKDLPNLNRLRSKISLIENRFQFTSKSYTITEGEINYLLENPETNNISIEFSGVLHSAIFEEFVFEVNVKGLYELRSIKLLNIYLISFNEKIKNYILDDIFSKNNSVLLTPDTKSIILSLPNEELHSLRNHLSDVLSLLEEGNWWSEVNNRLNQNSAIVLSDEVLSNSFLKRNIMDSFNVNGKQQLLSWKNIEELNEVPVLILAYRDQGKNPYYFFPNLLELPNTKSLFKSIFPNWMFGLKYNWAKYNLLNEKLKLLMHPYRFLLFEWSKIESLKTEIKPQTSDSTDWLLENDYYYSQTKTGVQILYKKNRKPKIEYPSELFLIEFKTKQYKVQRIDSLLGLDFSEEHFSIQKLDDIQEEINIYEKFFDFNKDPDLIAIRRRFDINESDQGRLWKILLKAKVDKLDVESVYEQLKSTLELENLRMVSMLHFRNSWINIDDESLTPLNRKVFFILCKYLDIPRSYVRVMQRIKNASIQRTVHATKQMNNLLKDLFNDGCFDEGKEIRNIIESRLPYYKKNHPLDEIGVHEDHVLDNLNTLVELIKPELSTLEVESITTENREL